VIIAIAVYLTLNLIHSYQTQTQLKRIVRSLDRIENSVGTTYGRTIDNNDRLIELKKELLGIDDRKPPEPGIMGVDIIDAPPRPIMIDADPVDPKIEYIPEKR
jgi:hypothetical protein